MILLTLTLVVQQVNGQIIGLKSGADAKVESQPVVTGKFAIEGEISSENDNTFVVSDERIAIPVNLYESLGLETIEVGNTVNVKGVVSNGIKVAQKIELVQKPGAKTEISSNYFSGLINALKNIFVDM